jgi:hypothetical protein
MASYWPRRTSARRRRSGRSAAAPVEIHGKLEPRRDLLPESPRQVDALFQTGRAERHERDDVDSADARVGTRVLLHVDQLEARPTPAVAALTTGSALPANVTTLRLWVGSSEWSSTVTPSI